MARDIFIRLFFSFCLSSIFLSGVSFASEDVFAYESVKKITLEQVQQFKELQLDVNNIEKRIAVNVDNDEKLVEEQINLEKAKKSIIQIGLIFRPILDKINFKISEIVNNQSLDKTDPKVTNAGSEEQKKELEKQKTRINELMINTADLLTRVNSLSDNIVTLRRQLFTNFLFKRYEPKYSFTLDAAKETFEEFVVLGKDIFRGISHLVHMQFYIFLGTTFFALFWGCIVYLLGRYLLNKVIDKDKEEAALFSINRLSVAFWSTMLPSLALVLSFFLLVWAYETYHLLEGEVLVYFKVFLKNTLSTFFIYRFAYSVLSPDLPKWRLIAIEPRPAYKLIFLLTSCAFIIGVDDLMSKMSDTFFSSLSVTVFRSLCAALLVGLMMIAFVQVKPFRDAQGKMIKWSTSFRLIIYFLSILIISAAIAGYISFARFLSSQIIITSTWVATAYIGLLASRSISEEGNFGRIFIGRWLKNLLHIEDHKLDQISLLVSGLINILLVVIFLPFVLLQWGFQSNDIFSWIYRVSAGFQIGSFYFSPISFVWGVVVFILCYLLTKWFQNWVKRKILARSHIDKGVSSSIQIVIGYLGIGLSFLIGISSAGLNLSSLAMIAGGLSLGIGFGLQNIVSNFVSGLILLFERPFKPGDWIVAGEISGIVKKINVRATEIETFQNQTIMLPNSQIINSALGNWTHQNKIGRIDIPVLVGLDADIQQVDEILTEAAKKNSSVLQHYKIFIAFMGMVNTGLHTFLKFEIRVFVADINNDAYRVQKEILFTVINAFKEKGINMQ